MIRTTRWSPDTCGCVLEYEWDDAVPEAQRTHTPTKAVKKCPNHQQATVASVFNKVHEENTRKNIALKELLENVPAAQKRKVDDGNGGQRDDFVTPPIWSFNAERELEIELPGLSQADKNKIAAKFSRSVVKLK